MTDQRKQLGTLIDDHILVSGKEYRTVAAEAGVSVETLGKARRGEKINARSLRKIEAALGWAPGASDHILAGTTPPAATDPGPLLVPRGGRPPIEDTDPELRLEGKAPLRDGELLEAWVRDDDKWHYHYATADLDLRTAFEAGLSLEDAVRKLRAMAAIHRSDM
ncbi:hypothetical protein ACIRPH_30805 [Nocardiopsis sp. NPDC101807]|uniref:hypothetical protein n=1 Tax=Nocardiopsis sp. NPDC101807 TaxID=3364339 RepID=UPI00380FC888